MGDVGGRTRKFRQSQGRERDEQDSLHGGGRLVKLSTLDCLLLPKEWDVSNDCLCTLLGRMAH